MNKGYKLDSEERKRTAITPLKARRYGWKQYMKHYERYEEMSEEERESFLKKLIEGGNDYE